MCYVTVKSVMQPTDGPVSCVSLIDIKTKTPQVLQYRVGALSCYLTTSNAESHSLCSECPQL